MLAGIVFKYHCHVLQFPTSLPWLRRLVAGPAPRRPELDIRLAYVIFLTRKVALGRRFSQSTSVPPVNIISRILHTHLHVNTDLIGLGNGRRRRASAHSSVVSDMGERHWTKQCSHFFFSFIQFSKCQCKRQRTKCIFRHTNTKPLSLSKFPW